MVTREKVATVAMREECKHFQSRTYASGEVARFCVLGNAPDQPWECPAECMTFEPRFADVSWQHGSLARRPHVEDIPSPETPADDRREVLQAADDIIDAVAADFVAQRREELDKQARQSTKRTWKFWRR